MTAVFPNRMQEELWRLHYCDRCLVPERDEGCAIFARSLTEVPDEWKAKRGKIREAKDRYRCTAFVRQPVLFDVQPIERRLVEVAGWPDYRRQGRT